MIKQLEIKVDSELYHSNTKEIIDKINEIIDFLNDTYLMRVKDGQYVFADNVIDTTTCLATITSKEN